jgi:single-strand DNA-binding protein
VNVITLTGHLIDNPARTDTGKGIKAPFHLDVDGRRRLRLPVTTWNQLAGTCAAHLIRGRHVAVTGRLDHSQFTGHDGKKRDRWEIAATAVTFLDTPPDDVTASSAPGASGRRLSAVAGSTG